MKKLFIILAFLTGCSIQSSMNESNETVIQDPQKESRSLPDIIDQQYESSTGILSFEGVFRSMSNLTKIPTTNANVSRTYSDVKDLLASSNKLNLYTPSVQQGFLKLASEFCNEAVTNATRIRAIYPGYNASEVNIDELTETFISNFWDGRVSSDTKENAIDEYKTLLNDFKSEGMNSTNLVFSVCVASLSALPVLIY